MSIMLSYVTFSGENELGHFFRQIFWYKSSDSHQTFLCHIYFSVTSLCMMLSYMLYSHFGGNNMSIIMVSYAIFSGEKAPFFRHILWYNSFKYPQIHTKPFPFHTYWLLYYILVYDIIICCSPMSCLVVKKCDAYFR